MANTTTNIRLDKASVDKLRIAKKCLGVRSMSDAVDKLTERFTPIEPMPIDSNTARDLADMGLGLYRFYSDDKIAVIAYDNEVCETEGDPSTWIDTERFDRHSGLEGTWLESYDVAVTKEIKMADWRTLLEVLAEGE